jgi:hypothetical protein
MAPADPRIGPEPVARPSMSVVVGSNGAPGSVERCLTSLEPQVGDAEVLVCEPAASPRAVRDRFPWATFLERPGAPVPLLWRDGIDASVGSVVALTISPMQPAADWVATLRSELADGPGVVAGAIDPGDDLGVADWAEYLCRYAKDMRPFAARATTDLPGDNCAYRRDALDDAREVYRDGFWEPVVNRHLAETGTSLRHSPNPVVVQGPSAGWRAFARQRLLHGRAHGRQRGTHFSVARNVIGVLAAPLVPVLLTLRILREVTRRRRARSRALIALPWILIFNVAWAAGEARGHLAVLVDR